MFVFYLADGHRWGPAAVANAFIAAATVDAAGKWYCCPHCKQHHGVRGDLLVHMTPKYLRALVAAEPWALMSLSFLDSPISLSSWTNAFTHGYVGPSNSHLWDSPLIRFAPTSDGLLETTFDRFALRVWEVNQRFNPYYQQLACLAQVGFAAYGHPCVDLRFFGPRTLATMHQAEDLSSQGDIMGASNTANPQYGVLDSSFVFDYRKDGIFEVREWFCASGVLFFGLLGGTW